MKYAHVGSVSLVWVALGVAGACSNDGPRPQALSGICLINTDCMAPLVCAFRACHNACTESRDCQPGQRCVASDRPYHVCQLANERDCTYNSDCPEGEACGVDLQCRDQCSTGRDCLRNQVCTNGTCADLEELDGGKLVSRTPDAGADAAATRGVPCLYTSECPAPLVCLSNICAPECLKAVDCPAGRDCVDNRCLASSGSVVGSEGGTVSAVSGKVTLTVPPGALRTSASILVLPLEAWPAGAIGPVFEILPSGLTFDVPATLTYRYVESELGGVKPSDLSVAQATGSTWTALASTLDTNAGTISASIAHLSAYGLIGPQ
jgi:hypothetical protein